MSDFVSKSAMKDCTSKPKKAKKWSYLALELHDTCFDHNGHNHSEKLIKALRSMPQVAQAIVDALQDTDPNVLRGELNLTMGVDSAAVRSYNLKYIRRYLHLNDAVIYTPDNPTPEYHGHKRVLKFHIGTDHIKKGKFHIDEEDGEEYELCFDSYNPPEKYDNGNAEWKQRCFIDKNFPKLASEGGPCLAFVTQLYEELGYWQQKARCNIYIDPMLFDGRPHLLDVRAAQAANGKPIWEIKWNLVAILFHELSHTTLMCECEEPEYYETDGFDYEDMHNCEEYHRDNWIEITEADLEEPVPDQYLQYVHWRPCHPRPAAGVHAMYNGFALLAARILRGRALCLNNAESLMFLVCAYYLRKHYGLDCRSGIMRKPPSAAESGADSTADGIITPGARYLASRRYRREKRRLMQAMIRQWNRDQIVEYLRANGQLHNGNGGKPPSDQGGGDEWVEMTDP